MDAETRARLRRLGVVKGARELKPARRTKERRQPEHPIILPGADGHVDDDGEEMPIEALLPRAQLVLTDVGQCLVLDTVYPPGHQHAHLPLSSLLRHKPGSLSAYCGDDRLEQLDFRDFLFLDTETTGLSGAGTLAFMVGTGFYETGAVGDVFVVRQFFLRDHGDEAAMLYLLEALVEEKAAVVTFNGRSFDLPLLDSRFLMNRMSSSLLDLPHVDLLPPSRRLWRRRVGSCALGNLERQLLKMERSHEDVPGWLIPGLYRDYLLTGDGRELLRVFYHNEIDMLSMVALLSAMAALVGDPGAAQDAVDVYSLGKWQADLGLTAASEQNLRQAADGELQLDLYHEALHHLGLLLKRAGRYEEAVPVWQQIAATSYSDVSAHVELAKHYEWRDKDLALAITWTENALRLVEGASTRLVPAVAELEHRLSRLQRKWERRSPDAQE